MVDDRVVEPLNFRLHLPGDGRRQMVEADRRRAARQHLGLGDHLDQLAHVQRPVVQHHRLEGVGIEAAPVGDVAKEVRAKPPQILDALAQRQQANRLRAQPPEQRLLDVSALVQRDAAGGGDDAHVRLDDARRSQRRESLVLQEPQQLGLQLDRHVADLVQEQRAARRRLDQADLARLRGRVGALLVAEQLAFDQLARDGRAVHRDQRPGAPRQVVDGARVNFLSHAGLADQQDLGARLGEPPQPRVGRRQQRRQRRNRRQRFVRVLVDRLQLRRGVEAEHQHVRPQEQHRAVAQRRRARDALAVDEGAVGAAQVLDDEQVGPVGGPLDAGVLPRDGAVRQRQRRAATRCPPGGRCPASDPATVWIRGRRRVSGEDPSPTTTTAPIRMISRAAALR